MFNAYHRIFERTGLQFRAVHADSGAIGGEGGSHEFMALADIGEDTIAVCSSCNYAANLEQAEAIVDGRIEQHDINVPPIEKFYTPELRTIEQLERVLDIRPEQIIKTLIYEGGSKIFAVLVRGDHEVNEIKVSKYIGINEITLAAFQSSAGCIEGIRTSCAPVSSISSRTIASNLRSTRLPSGRYV